MIALDFQPFSIVEDLGFRQLLEHLEPRYSLPSRKYFSEKIIPEMYDDTVAVMKQMIDGMNGIGITTDIWTSSTNLNAFISLTAHFITVDFEQQILVLNTKPFSQSHTGKIFPICYPSCCKTGQSRNNKLCCAWLTMLPI